MQQKRARAERTGRVCVWVRVCVSRYYYYYYQRVALHQYSEHKR